mgnify:CR=1 FL=1
MPLIPLRIGGRVVEFVIDTGFDGEAALPHELARELGITPIVLAPVELGDGSLRLMGVSIASVEIEGIEIPIEVLLGSSDPIVGTGFLRHFRLVLDMRAGLVELEFHRPISTAA